MALRRHLSPPINPPTLLIAPKVLIGLDGSREELRLGERKDIIKFLWERIASARTVVFLSQYGEATKGSPSE